ncbi:hypothetical protein [Streptomyces sp. DASNCL29]|uniref:hypothetical protein n=1 Tax=Streptomyces TaxID=1883 RepID=UPI0014866E5E|nr:hypothetical protein [Streptomyces sp. DASNCL29]
MPWSSGALWWKSLSTRTESTSTAKVSVAMRAMWWSQHQAAKARLCANPVAASCGADHGESQQRWTATAV